MGKYYFTEEQQINLRKNNCIKKVSEKAITYTVEFKKCFLDEYRAGKLPYAILIDKGIDPKVLGKSRIRSLTHRIMNNEARLEGQEDTRKSNPGRPTTKHLTDEEKIKRLEQKINYLNQENEFLKKNMQMDKLATTKFRRQPPKSLNSSKK